MRLDDPVQTAFNISATRCGLWMMEDSRKRTARRTLALVREASPHGSYQSAP